MKLTADDEVINYLKDYFNKDFIEITVDGEKKIFVSEEKLKEKDKIIDLMAKCIDIELSRLRLGIILNKNVKPLESYKKDIKQYFERKLENGN